MSYQEVAGDMLMNWGWLIIIGLLLLFLLIGVIIFAFLWWKGKIPLFKKYNITYILREVRDNRLMPVRIGKARAYTEGSGMLYALKTGFMSEIKGVPAPSYNQLYANDWAEFAVLDREMIYPVINRRGSNDAQGGIVPIENVIKGDLEVDRDETKRRMAWKDAERHRMQRQKNESAWLLALPYAALIVSMVGCFLIIAMLATPITTTIGSSVAVMQEHKEANEYLYKAVMIAKAGQNGTVPMPDPEQRPPG